MTTQAVGATWAEGLETLDAKEGPVTVESILPRGSLASVVVGVMLVGPDARKTVQLLDALPPPDHPAFAGSVKAGLPREIKAGETWEVVIGYRTPSEGKWSRDGLEINYIRAGVPYRQVLAGEVTLCSSGYAEQHPAECRIRA